MYGIGDIIQRLTIQAKSVGKWRRITVATPGIQGSKIKQQGVGSQYLPISIQQGGITFSIKVAVRKCKHKHLSPRPQTHQKG